MCGIGGYIGSESESFRTDLAQSMCLAMQHRGPDAKGVFVDDGIALAHTRLSILDLTEQGAQPMRSPCNRYALSYNGEIYNFQVIKQELESLGRSFISLSDTEVVLHALLEWGEAALAKFNGMFALAWWDSAEKSLLLARDRFGIKPLYYCSSKNGLAFASEVHTLVSSSVLEPRLSLQGLHEYLFFGNALGENTLFDSCHKLPAGSCLSTRVGETAVIRKYWHAGMVDSHRPSEQEAVESIQQLLQASVERHLISDVPVGLFLSGGLDSSTLCAFASKMSDKPLTTYSVEFEGMSAHSELALAREVSSRFNTQHNEISIGWKNLESTLEALTEAHGQPFGDAGNLPLYLLTEKLPSDVKVVLQGDGGDELFGGYRRYRLLRYTALSRALAKTRVSNVSLPRLGSSFRRMQRMLGALGAENAARRCALLLTEEPGARSVNSLLRPELVEQLSQEFPINRYEQILGELPDHALSDPRQTMLYVDMQILLCDYFFEKVDRSTMANSVEVRVPFLDNELCDYVMGLPAGMKLYGASKRLLRKAMQGTLPESVIKGRKYGFGVPYVEWLKGPLAPYVEQHLLDSNGLMYQLFDRSAIQKIWQEFKAGTNNRGFMIYKLLMLSIWLKRYKVEL